MAITIKLKDRLTPQQEQWLSKNIGPRMHYLVTSIGGQGWIAKKQHTLSGPIMPYWTLTLEDEKYASWFRIMFPE